MSNKYSNNFITNLDNETFNTLKENNYLEQKKLEKLILDAKDTYYNNTGILIIKDATFDFIIEILEKMYPKSKVLDSVGSELSLNATNKVRLPYHLGSMDKVKPGSRKFHNWINKYNTNNYIISEKLDGLSGLLILTLNEDNSNIKIISKLYTRGNGDIGQDISHLLPFIKFNNNNNETLASRYKYFSKYMKDNNLNQISIRGEIIIKKELFIKKYSSTYPKGRTLVSSIINSKADAFNKPELRNKAKHIEFICYQIIYPELHAKTQFNTLSHKLQFKTAYYEHFNSTLTINECEKLLLKFKENSNYDIDGIIITDNSLIYSNPIDGNPKYSVAFKMPLEDEQTNETIIEYIEYNVSKNGILKPRIKYNPIKIGGDTFVYTTGFNAKYIKDNKLGPGARITIIKSGDVIPYIYKILSPSTSKDWQQPTQDWSWNASNVEAVINNITDLPMEKVLLQFFNQFDIDKMKEGVISRLINAGIDSINDILRLKVETLLEIDGFHIKSSNNLVNQIKTKIIDIEHPLSKLMVASNCFPNFGIKKIKLITDNFKVKDILNNNIHKEKLCNIEGLGDITSNDFLKYLPNFLKWLKEHNNIIKISFEQNKNINLKSKNKYKIDTYISGKNIVFTGFRNKKLEEYIEQNNGKLQSGVFGKTNLVVAKDITDTSSKVNKAHEKGIKVISLEEFLGIINYKE